MEEKMGTIAVETKNNIADEMINIVNSLTINQQKELMNEASKMARMNRIEKLNCSVKPNNITMEEIVAETKAARREADENARK
jgi:DNA-binding protein H-NS